ncbi:MAG TPA: hypothetical protein VLA61_21490 [Ideonella sp.]|uniref:hypothetical protein n=1 Tax=Ideonella sp. TaxID=1929293 RepID=UPI002C3BBABA|nr:hypothetical protein [Ideonella sp.]HSI50849.1 hypothetical protein [Ideonella sp.]
MQAHVRSEPYCFPENSPARLACDWLMGQLGDAAQALMLLHPDGPGAPAADTLALLVLDHGAQLRQQRCWPAGMVDGRRLPSLQLTRLPAAWLAEPGRLACADLLTHRIVHARLLDTPPTPPLLARQLDASLDFAHAPAARAARCASFAEAARFAAEQACASQAFPGLARLWLQKAHAAALALLLDGCGRWCPAADTQAPLYWPVAEALLGMPLAAQWTGALGLDDDPSRLATPLRRMQMLLLRDCVRMTPDDARWPAGVSTSLRWAYAYWHDPRELEARLGAAQMLAQAGQPGQAVCQLREVGFALARVAMLRQRVRERWSHPLQFEQPECDVAQDLFKHHPDMLDELRQVLAGPSALSGWSLAPMLNLLARQREATQAVLANHDPALAAGLAAAPAWALDAPPPDPQMPSDASAFVGLGLGA